MGLVDMASPLAKPEDDIWTTTIMTYELGSLIRALCKARVRRAWGDEKGARAYEAEGRIELSDLITQCRFLAEQKGWGELQLRTDGEERFLERMREYDEGMEGE